MTELKGYHAHVYYDAARRPIAIRNSEATANVYLEQLPGALNSVHAGFFTVRSEPAGERRVTIFLSRSGYELPSRQ